MKTFNIAGHDYQAENCIDSVLINPVLPDDFDSTPIDARTEDDLDKWYNLPYIVTSEYQADNYKDYCDRCITGIETMTEDAFSLVIADNEAKWTERFPNGKAYWIYCLSSGKWDRPTLWGISNSLDDAVALVKSRQGVTA